MKDVFCDIYQSYFSIIISNDLLCFYIFHYLFYYVLLFILLVIECAFEIMICFSETIIFNSIHFR